MRSIKFRAWDKKENRWIKICGFKYSDGQLYPLEWRYEDSKPADKYCYIPEDVSIVMFTGLHDKNGKEIYEGDVVTEGYNNKYGTFVVKWDKCGFNLNTGGDGSFEIIGNIHEHPTLLTNLKIK